MMRSLCKLPALLYLFLCLGSCARPGESERVVMTVSGPIPADSLGLTLIH